MTIRDITRLRAEPSATGVARSTHEERKRTCIHPYRPTDNKPERWERPEREAGASRRHSVLPAELGLCEVEDEGALEVCWGLDDFDRFPRW